MGKQLIFYCPESREAELTLEKSMLDASFKGVLIVLEDVGD